MAARLDSVARFLCEESGWTLSNLQLQKMIYFAQLEYMGRNDGDRLVDAKFQAWDNGPVIPELYHKLKAFGSGPVRDVFSDARPFSDGSPRAKLLGQICRDLRDVRPGALIELTHWEGGAWAEHYVPGAKGIGIPDRAILAEYRARRKARAAAH